MDTDAVGTIGNQIVIIISSLTALITAIGTLIVSLRTKKQTNVIQRDVNSNLTVATERIEQLSGVISDAGYTVPSTGNGALTRREP